MDDQTAGQVRELMGQGLAGTIFLTTEDVPGRLPWTSRAAGWSSSSEPTDQPYGIDSSFRDPSGNHLRLTQVREIAAV